MLVSIAGKEVERGEGEEGGANHPRDLDRVEGPGRAAGPPGHQPQGNPEQEQHAHLVPRHQQCQPDQVQVFHPRHGRRRAVRGDFDPPDHINAAQVGEICDKSAESCGEYVDWEEWGEETAVGGQVEV